MWTQISHSEQPHYPSPHTCTQQNGCLCQGELKTGKNRRGGLSHSQLRESFRTSQTPDRRLIAVCSRSFCKWQRIINGMIQSSPSSHLTTCSRQWRLCNAKKGVEISLHFSMLKYVSLLSITMVTSFCCYKSYISFRFYYPFALCPVAESILTLVL